MGWTGHPEMLVQNNHSEVCNRPEERRSQVTQLCDRDSNVNFIHNTVTVNSNGENSPSKLGTFVMNKFEKPVNSEVCHPRCVLKD